jgi:gamma-glutamylputrescine oxidase
MNQSIWEQETFFSKQDIIIVGSGVVGLWSAIHLKEKSPALKVSIVDRGLIPAGASTRNAGFSCFGSVSELVEDAAKAGTDKMLQLVEMRYRGLEKINQYFPAATIGYEATGGYEIFTHNDRREYEICRDEMQQLNQLLKNITGVENTYTAADSLASDFGFNGINHIIVNRLEGQLHSGKLVRALLMKAQSLGVQVFPGIEILRFELSGDGVQLFTNHNLKLSAERLLICTNGFAKQLLPALDINPARGQVLVTEPLPGINWQGCFHYQQGYFYFRRVGDRILLGGGRNLDFSLETTTSMETTETIQNALEHLLRETIIPGIPFQISNRWSGIMGIGSEKKPIIQAISEQVYCAVRMSGMGVALAPVIGEEVTKVLL